MKDDEMHFEGKVAQKAIIVSPSGRVLICRNHHDKELWDLPGGTLNDGEEPMAGLLREINEELGITPKIERIISVGTFIKPKTRKRVLVITYQASLTEELQNFRLDETEIAETRWIGRKNLSGVELFPEYQRILEDFFR